MDYDIIPQVNVGQQVSVTHFNWEFAKSIGYFTVKSKSKSKIVLQAVNGEKRAFLLLTGNELKTKDVTHPNKSYHVEPIEKFIERNTVNGRTKYLSWVDENIQQYRVSGNIKLATILRESYEEMIQEDWKQH